MEDFSYGVELYKVFKACLDEGKDRDKLARLESRLDQWHSALTMPQRSEFAILLVHQGIIPDNSPLGQAVKMFNASFVKFGDLI